MNRISKTKKIFIGVAILFVLVVVAVFFWYSFIKNEAANLLKVRAELGEEVSETYSLMETQKRLEELKIRNAQIDQIFVNRDEAVGFIEKIEEMAVTAEVRLEIQNVDAKRITSGTGDRQRDLYGTIEMNFRINGNWDQVSEMISAIENLPNHVRINSLKLDAANLTSGVAWTGNVSLTVITN